MNENQLDALFALQRAFPGTEVRMTGNRHLGGVKMNELNITVPLKKEQAEWWAMAQQMMAPAVETEEEDDPGQTDQHGTRTDEETGYAFYIEGEGSSTIKVIPTLNGRDAERFAYQNGIMDRYRELVALGNRGDLLSILRRKLTRGQFRQLGDLTDAALIVLILKIDRLEEAHDG